MGEKMRKKRKMINRRLVDLGRPLGINEIDAIKAKRTLKNIVTMTLFAGVFLILGNILMPGGPAGLFYTGASIKDFKILLGGWL